MTPAIVVLAFNRPAALRRLLASVAKASYPGASVPLVISIDFEASRAHDEVVAIARDFAWRSGPKIVLPRERHLGVVEHFRAAGALAREHGGAVLLEDDLVVAPSYYSFATAVLDTYEGDKRVAGACLYGLSFNGFTHQPFLPLSDGTDAFFLRLPYTQGVCFSASQWDAFEAWRSAGEEILPAALHPAFRRFGPDEWFPELAAYLAATKRYFCFPRVSQTVGWGDAGAHFAARSRWFQTPLQAAGGGFDLPLLDDALAVYDGFFELLSERLRRLAPTLPPGDIDLDLQATKTRAHLQCDLILTTRPARRTLLRFGLEMYPPELNVAWEIPGDEIALARVEDVRWDEWAEAEARRRLHDYYWRRNAPSRRRSLRFATARLVQRWRRQ